MATASAPSGQRLVLHGVDWRTYTRFLHLFSDRRAVRLTYDRGSLEIMTISHEHESYGWFLGRLAVTLTEELNLPLKGGGSTTFRRRRKKRGLEPDDCYWIANAALVRGKMTIDLRIDPPPDLAIEIDITSSSLNRLGIYSALRVPEVWRFDGQTLTFHVLGSDGHYAVTPTSLAFPFLKPDELVRFLNLRLTQDENEVVQDFRVWVRQEIAPGPRP